MFQHNESSAFRMYKSEPEYTKNMASTWTRVRMNYFKGFKTTTLVAGLVAVIILGYYVVGLLQPKPKLHVMYENDPPPKKQELPISEADKFLEFKLKDTRPQHCRAEDQRKKQRADNTPVSIILHFQEDEFYNLVYTIKSILKNTKQEAIKEIIFLDDGTKNPQIQEDSAKFFRELQKNNEFHVSHYGSDNAKGAATTRMMAVRVASSDILVFMDSDVMVNQGWLDPLLDHLAEEPHAIVVPHIDNVLKPNRFYELPESYGNIFGWSLNTYWYNTYQKADAPFPTAVMRGNVFAVKKDFLNQLGSFDEGLGAYGGENLELSLRAWLCGGKIHIVPCSRVAVRDALQILHISKKDNIHRIAELWFEDSKHHIYRYAGINNAMDETNMQAVRTRKSFLTKSTCKETKGIDWYLNSVVGDLPKPRKDTRLMGKIKTKSGHCAKSNENDHLDLVPCLLHMYDRDLMFELLDNGHIVIDDQCVQGNTFAKEVSIRACDDNNKYQTWEVTSSGFVKLKGSPYCMDYTRRQPTENPKVNLQECIIGQTHTWTFIVV